MLVKIISLAHESVSKGKTSYGKATITYNKGGETKTHTIVSFSNPAIYKNFADGTFNEGDSIEVTTDKDAKGYVQWTKVEKASSPANGGADVSIPAQAPRSNFETREERTARQVYIIKQSSIGHAIEFMKAANMADEAQVADVLEVAQRFVDYVLGTEEVDPSHAENS